jgi:DNA-binding LacI/PurR family transcriptional regulator/signal transduction histidine kinase
VQGRHGFCKNGDLAHAMRRTIAFLGDSLADGFQQSVWAAVRRATEALDLNLLCFLSGYVSAAQPGRLVFELLEPSRLAGIVGLSGTLGPSEADIRALYARFAPVPLVGIGRALEGVPSFLVDNRASISALVDHLVEVHGRRRIAFVRGPPSSMEAEVRYAAFREALARHGLSADPARVLDGNFETHTGLKAVQTLFARKVPFDALLAANDYMAIGAAEELVRRGLSIPEQVSVAGFDDVGEAAAATPSLTTVRQPIFEMVRDAVVRLLAAAEGAPLPALRTFAGELVLRNSCGCGVALQRAASARAHPPATVASGQATEGAAEPAAALEGRFPELAAKVGDDGWARRLAGALLEALAGGDERPFCEVVGGLMRAGHSAQVDLPQWYSVLDVAVEAAQRTRPGHEERLRELRDAALRTLGTTLEQTYLASQIGLERDVNVLRRLWQLNPVDPEVVWLTLQDQLPTMGIPSFYLCSYVEPEGRRARLDFHYTLTDSFLLDPEPGPYPLARLLPGDFCRERRHAFVVMPIKARGRESGFVVCEIGRMGGAGYESLVNQLSAATELRTLLSEVRSYATELEAKIEARTEELREAQRQVVDSAHRAGMAEIAVGLMHNVGNLLNSVSVSAERIVGLSDDPRLAGLFKTAELLERSPEELVRDGKAALLSRFVHRSAEELGRERQVIRTEGREMLDRITLIRDTVKTLQEYARGERDLTLHEPLDLRAVVETALKVQESNLSRHAVRVIRDLAPVPVVVAQRSKLVHVLVNLVKNGIEAMWETPAEDRVLTLQIRGSAAEVELRVRDAGEGIPEANLPRVFGYGFTTKRNGHGFGLYTCANHVKQMGGTIHAESPGPGKGTTFVIRFRHGAEEA